MPEVIHKSEEVFGIGRELPLNYVQRKDVDEPFFESLSRGKHIVIYGSSKQGKTSLRKTWLTDRDHLTVSCLSSMNLSQLNAAILKTAWYRLEQTISKSTDGSWKFSAELKAKAGIPLLTEASGGGGVERQTKGTEQQTTTRIELDLGDVNDIIQSLKEANAPKHIVLEDFHYLPFDTQSQFSIALKAFHENSDYTFVVIGVWREKNRLIYFNGDLTSRVVAIDADAWTKEELKSVVRAGEPLLNVRFDDEFVEGVVENSHNAVYLVQEGCALACHKAKVYQTGDQTVQVGKNVDTAALIKSVVDEQAGRYIAFLNNVSEGFQKSELEMYRWLLYALLKCNIDELHQGLRMSAISTIVKEHHPLGETLNEGNITQALTSIASLQVTKNIRPIILDYDPNKSRSECR
ncbi:hypothetical protein FBZ89_104265 [Nitrospirillum amazonense]|uniref:Uncharacterized protein n=1 Tax=Nitrospirillum amazonense TaxID=28077 RepID=A0A560FK85_9PROT|nr:hypothetical protein [Nitrospirillum amazonense]TWB22017.1 hypothetical protein FBZ89_104265 [Nitrospirillum amazonense]